MGGYFDVAVIVSFKKDFASFAAVNVEQVIIFIKDTDGELAEDYMGNRIGSRHQFDKKNEFETNLV